MVIMSKYHFIIFMIFAWVNAVFLWYLGHGTKCARASQAALAGRYNVDFLFHVAPWWRHETILTSYHC